MASSTSYSRAIKNASVFVGPSVISVFIQAVQTGILICLHMTFWSQPSEGKVIPYLVAFISLVGLYQTCLSTQQLWNITVTNFGDWDLVFAWPWINKITYLINSLIAVPVQIFLARRCWLLWGKRKSLLVVLSVLQLAYIGVTLGVTIEFLVVGPNTYLGYVSSSGNKFQFRFGSRLQILSIMPLVLDTILTLLLMVRLIRLRSSTCTRKFRKILKVVIMLTWETAVPPSACAIAIVVFFGSGTESNFWFKTSREILGKLYIMSFMIILNSRAYLSELEQKDVTLQLPSLLPVTITDCVIHTQPGNGTSSAPAPAESKHTEVTPEPDERPPASQ